MALGMTTSRAQAHEHASSQSSGAVGEYGKIQQYTCPMHPEVITDHPGNCPKCGMELVPKKEKTKTKPKSHAGESHDMHEPHGNESTAHESHQMQAMQGHESQDMSHM